jgi:hypothetical protein
LFLTVAVGIVVHDISLKELKIDWTPMKIWFFKTHLLIFNFLMIQIKKWLSLYVMYKFVMRRFTIKVTLIDNSCQMRQLKMIILVLLLSCFWYPYRYLYHSFRSTDSQQPSWVTLKSVLLFRCYFSWTDMTSKLPSKSSKCRQTGLVTGPTPNPVGYQELFLGGQRRQGVKLIAYIVLLLILKCLYPYPREILP